MTNKESESDTTDWIIKSSDVVDDIAVSDIETVTGVVAVAGNQFWLFDTVFSTMMVISCNGNESVLLLKNSRAAPPMNALRSKRIFNIK